MTEQKYHHGDLRRALIDAGLDLLEQRNVAQLSLRAIAARAGVSHAAPKNHFGSFKGLLTAMVTRGFELHAEYMQSHLDPDASRHDQLRAACSGYVRFAIERPNLFQLMFSHPEVDFEDPGLRAAGHGSYQVLERIASGLKWRGSGHPQAQTMTEMMLWSVVHGYAHLVIHREIAADGRTPPFPIDDLLPSLDYD